MKNTLLILTLLLCVFCLTSCDQREGKDLPSMFDAYLDPTEDFYLVLEYFKDLDSHYRTMRVDLVSKYKLESLRLNETLIPIDNFNYLESSGAFWYDFDLSGLNNAIIGDYNEELAYQMVFEHKTVSGLLQTPAEYFCEAPDFDSSQDYPISWTLDTHPKAQNIRFSLGINHSAYFRYTKELNPAKRSYTLSKSMWNELGSVSGVEIELQASNYRYTAGGLVWIISAAECAHWSYDKARPSGLERIQRLIRKEIVLPE